MKKYSYHAVANVFPLDNDGPDFDALVSNIKRSGLHHPIVLHEGKILDGRRRYLACQMLGIEASFVQWNGKGSPLDFAISSNVYRSLA